MKRQVPETRHEELQLRFRRFDQENPHVYEAYTKWVFRLLNDGHSHLSSGMILSLLRSDPSVRSKSGNKLGMDQNFSAFFTKKFTAEYPQHSKVFKVRKQSSKGRLPLKTDSRSRSRKAKAVSKETDMNRGSIKRSA